MYGRRDLVDAHLFLRGRLSAAVLRSDPDSPDRPLRRTSTGMGIGVAVAAAAIVVVVVLNMFLFTTNDSWRKQRGALLVDDTTGSRYLLIDDVLHPILNLASAALLVGGPPPVVRVSSADLASVPRGRAVGTEGLPDELPSPSSTSSTWTACAADGATTLTIGGAARTTPSAAGEGMLVTSAGELWLVWGGVRSRVDGAWAARAIGFEPTDATPVEQAWLDTIPDGRDLSLAPLTLGGAGPDIAGEPTVLGQVMDAGDDGSRYVVTPEGLMPVTETVAALLTAAPDSALPAPRALDRRNLVAARITDAASWQDDLPRTPPTPAAAGVTPCSVWGDGGTTLAFVDDTARSGSRGSIEVAPGSGLLAATAAAPGVAGIGLYLVSDDGTKYPVADSATASALGLDVSRSPAVPGALLALLPTGPTIAT
ncbi:type VII secretion protein EccB [uncultured Microbacterium sp.]|uniref:type VII secretion protein EccB n=1 Tax=uncultured Microbacterium sp. TaxID=191216 RepID=UPI0025F2B0E2|nr:type VII secretion protein EccB [uncultured Microbacterium sp.]